jgi:antitoxin MazE
MPSKLCKWGNSLGLRVPQHIAERASLRAGDYMYVRLMDSGDIVIRPVSARDIPAGYMPDDAPPNAKIEVPTDEEVLAKW